MWFLFISFLVSISIPGSIWAQGSPYFPEAGKAAVYQRSLDLQNPSVVLSISLEPGFEDLATLAYLRLSRGASVISAYVTNGEATPSDINGEVPFRVAARRKDESFRAISYIGGQAYFLNLQDPGFISTREKLERYWNPDSLRAKLRSVIDKFSPDVILLNRDFRGEGGETLRQSLVQSVLLEVIQAKRDSGGVQGTRISRGKPLGQVQRVLVDRGKSDETIRPNIELRHPLWKKSYRQVGLEAERFYPSLQGHLRAWHTGGERSYTCVYPASGGAIRTIEQGLSFNSPRLNNLSRTVADVAKLARATGTTSDLPMISVAIDSIDLALGRAAQGLTAGERRLLIGWKLRLENLRCSVLMVDVKFEVSESTVTQSQLFFLKFRTMKADITRGRTDIFFPSAGPNNWIIDESMERQFPFEVPKEYRILSPRQLEFDTPTYVFGIDRPTLATNLTFIIIHRDSLRERNFQFRREIPFRTAPRFSTEVLTPLVYGVPNERLIYRLTNFTRDGVYGETFVDDSVAFSDKKPFRLRSKDSSVLDTLTLQWREPLREGHHLIDLKVSGETEGRFVARRFDVAVDTTKRVGLITSLEGSPIEETLRRLRVSFEVLDSALLKTTDLSRFDVIVLDRDVTALRKDINHEIPRLISWVRTGGHLSSFHQYLNTSGLAAFTQGLGFRYGPGLDPDSEVLVDSTHDFLLKPNKIQPSDWDGWIFARARGSIDVKDVEKVEMIVKSSQSNESLLVTIREGKGLISLVALDLSSQFLNIHPGAFRLFANLLSHTSKRL